MAVQVNRYRMTGCAMLLAALAAGRRGPGAAGLQGGPARPVPAPRRADPARKVQGRVQGPGRRLVQHRQPQRERPPHQDPRGRLHGGQVPRVLRRRGQRAAVRPVEVDRAAGQVLPRRLRLRRLRPGRQKVATFDGQVWFAPLTGGGDLLVYRKDLLEKAGIKPPTTLEEFAEAAKKLNDPANGVYGVALRGQRGSGANVWRWMPFFRGYGGQWFDGDKPVFDSPAAVKATQTYLDLFKYSAPVPRPAAGTSPPALSSRARWRC